MSTDSSPSSHGWPVAAGAFLLLASFAFATVRWYVGHERTFYWWDYAVHQDLATRTARAFERSFAEGSQVLGRSTHEDYNAILAVPLAPFLLLFGASREAYVGGLAFAYLLPFALALGSTAAALIRGPRAAVFWTTAALTLLTPMAWVPLLRGYPDVGAALFVVLAVRLCVSDPTLRRPRTVVLVGVLLGTAAVCRRHFLFATPALLAAAALCAVGDEAFTRGRRAGATRRLLGAALRILLAAAAGMAFAFVVGRPVALRWLSHDFHGLYSGYLVPARPLLRWYGEAYGWLAWLGAAAGLAAGSRAGILDRRAALFLGGFAFASVVQWTAIVRQVGEQYTLHFTPSIVLGLVALGWTLGQWRGGPWPLARAALGLYVVVNFVFGLTDLPIAQQRVPLRFALCANWPPLEHVDPAGVARLVEELRRVAAPDEPIFVVASSQALNPDLLSHAERALHGWEDARLRIVDSPAVDSRDRYPLEPLLQARIVVDTSPVQLHLSASEQRVVLAVHEMFEEGGALARDFAALEQRLLVGPAMVRLYRRTRVSSLKTGLATLRYLQERIPRPPGEQPDWVVVSGRYPAWTYRSSDGSSTLIWHPTPVNDTSPAVALYLGSPPATIHAGGRFEFRDARCPGAAIRFAFLAPDGSMADAGVPAVTRRPDQAGEFETVLAARSGGRLAMRLTPGDGQTSVDYCLLQIDRLAVR